jgi:hypothetical protein
MPTLHMRDDAVSELNRSAEYLLLESRLAQLDEAIVVDLLLSWRFAEVLEEVRRTFFGSGNQERPGALGTSRHADGQHWES